MYPIIIIGAGLAGYELAKEFRKLDQTTPLKIITASEGRFYSKPLLSTALTNGRSIETLTVANADTMAERLNATILVQTRVTQIDPEQYCIYIDEKKIPYSRLILACGANPIRPSIKGNGVGEIHSVNNLEDYHQFRQSIHGRKRLAILGAGLVGCEFANDLINADYQVDVIAPANYPLENLLPEQVGLILQAALAQNGVRWHLGQLITEIQHADDCYRLLLSSNREIKVDKVLSAIGLQSCTELAEKAGIQIGRGIMVDSNLQTSAKDIFALGDCAEVNGRVMLFVAPLLHCARALAKTLAGEVTSVAYPVMPISIKTPACPIVILPPSQRTEGKWNITGENENLKALFVDKQGALLGFALTGKAVSEKVMLIKQLSIGSEK